GRLDGKVTEQLQSALLAAFPTRSALTIMVRFQLGENLDALASPGSLKTTVFELITWAESQGRVADLVEGARTANPGNPALRAFAAAYSPPASPSVAPSRAGRTSLPHATLLEVHEAAIGAGLNQVRGALLGGIDVALVAALPGSSTPAGQLLTDLDELNKLGRVPDGSVPLATWLTNALVLVGPRREAGVFQDALAALST
ncbi:MAG: effector-associated domain EAD1-containing protein, partial [Byssovorax sp.]